MKVFNCNLSNLRPTYNLPGFYLLDCKYTEDRYEKFEIESKIDKFEVSLSHGDLVLINNILYLVHRDKIRSWPIYQIV
jgi:hypothetical protein